MRYLLAVLTCGRPEYLTPTLATYAEFLHPKPTAVYAWDDGLRTPREAFAPFSEVERFVIEGESKRIGRCSGHAHLWQAARKPEFSDIDWLFTIEDDVVLLRPLNLFHMAEVLEHEPTLEQLALVRCPWGAEIEHGGYIPMFRDRYTRRETHVAGSCPAHWISSTIDWTSSPALLPASLPREIEWPGGSGCELELGPRIMALRPNAVSGYWGWGECQAAHVGMERAEGSHGY